jgi:hypothetical protein
MEGGSGSGYSPKDISSPLNFTPGVAGPSPSQFYVSAPWRRSSGVPPGPCSQILSFDQSYSSKLLLGCALIDATEPNALIRFHTGISIVKATISVEPHYLTISLGRGVQPLKRPMLHVFRPHLWDDLPVIYQPSTVKTVTGPR